MAGLKSSMMVFMMMMMVATLQMQSTNAQTRHVVGDALGWTIPANGAAAYTTWASQQTFTVGDTLFFNFTTGMHNVAEVSQAAYGPCTTANPMSLTATGPATVMLTAAGTHYYICTVGTHCQIGQKLTINVSAAAPTTPPPAAAPTTPPPAAAPTTPPAATPTTPPAVTPTLTPTPAPVSPPATTPAPAAAPTTTPAVSPTTPPAATPTPVGASPPSPTASDTTPPPSPSAAARAAVVPATLLAFALALFF